MPGLISLLATLLVLMLIAGLVWWILGTLPLPAPFDKTVRAIFAVIVILIAVGMLLGHVPIIRSY